MKRLFHDVRLVLSICLVFSSLLAHGQNTAKPLYAVADYKKVAPENIRAYLELEQNIWKPMQQERIDLGKIVGWYLYAVNFTGTNNEYNYVTIVVYDNLDSLEHPWSASVPAKVHPDKQVVDILKQSNVVRSRVRSEMYQRITSAPQVPMEDPSPYIMVNFMRVPQGKADEYERLEHEIWQPIQEELVKRGKISGWGLWSLAFPRGDDLAYQYLTLDGVPRFSGLFGINYSEVFEVVHPHLSDDQIAELTNKSRSNARTELWELIDYIVK